MSYTEILDRLNLTIPEFFQKISESHNFNLITQDPEEEKFCKTIKYFLKNFYEMILDTWESLLSLVDESVSTGNYSYFFEQEFKNFMSDFNNYQDVDYFDLSAFDKDEIYESFRDNLYVYYHETERGEEFFGLPIVMIMVMSDSFIEEGFEALLEHDENVRNATMDWVYRNNYPMISEIINFLMIGVQKSSIEIDENFLDELLKVSLERRTSRSKESKYRKFGRGLLERYQKTDEMKMIKEKLRREIFGN